MGENKTAPWTQTTPYEIPQISAPASTGWTKGSLADYMGYPTGVTGYKASALPFRAYALIYNEWFRDQNLKNPCYISIGDADTTGVDIQSATYDYVTDTECGAAPVKAAKMHDYFTSCLPAAQKGPAVNIPLGSQIPVTLAKPEKNVTAAYTYNTDLDGREVGLYLSGSTFYNYDPEDGGTNLFHDIPDTYPNAALVVDLSTAVGATVSQLRQAFQIQKFYEKQALYGTRYIEMIKGHFGVTNPDFRMQRPEYLGGFRQPININQVVQTDATSSQITYDPDDGWGMKDLSPQGNTAAYSLTSGRNKDLFTHSFTEHGILMGLAVVRQTHTYQQGLNRQFMQKSMFDFYFPEFANLSNQPVYNKEIYCQNDSVVDADGKVINDKAFGYQEAWAHYRYMPDIVTGEMRSNVSDSLDVWHWADDYNALPQLGDQWIDETKENIERTLAVQNHDQFMGDFFFSAVYTRPMPLYSIPGLIDHH